MPQPAAEAFHVDSALTNISIAILQDASGFIAPRVFPNVPVQKKSDVYYVFDRNYFNRNEAKKRAAGTKVAEGGYALDTAPYTCEEAGLAIPITDQARANADPAAPPDRAATEFVTHKALIEMEVDFVAAYMSSGKWTTDIAGVASSPSSGEVIQWSDYVNSDPIGDIRTGVDTIMLSTGMKPNVLTIGRPTFSGLIDHPDIQGRINGGATTTQPSIANLNLLAQIFEVDEVIVGHAIVNSAAEGATAVNGFIVGKSALLTYRPPSPAIMTAAAGYRFSWAGYLGGTNEFGFVIDTKRRDEEDSDVVRYRSHYVHKLVTPDLGYFFGSIVA